MKLYRHISLSLTAFSLLFLSCECIAAENISPRSVNQPSLGESPEKPKPPDLKINQAFESYSVPADRTGSWTVDISNRQQSRAFYNSVYLASEETPIDWFGDISTCSQGTTGSDFKNSILVRVNYYREMAGVPSDISFSPASNDNSQLSALMMSRNDTLDHTPPTSWHCYSEDGAEAAGSSNLSLGSYGWQAVDGQMRDNGSNNSAVGHRRWILYPQTQEMGTGDVPYSESGSPPVTYAAANSLMVFDDHMWEPRPETRFPFVSWPPPGYTPYQIVPPRWSFSVADADFSSASVTMTLDGNPVPVVKLPLAFNRGENTIVWVPDNLNADVWYTRWPKPDEDTTYTVTISNYLVGDTSYSQSYDVTVFDPAIQGTDEEIPVISGPAYPIVGTVSAYSFNQVSFAERYELMQAGIIEEEFFEGAENGLDQIIDFSSAAYDLITAGDASTGTHSLHLAHPNGVSESFELDKTFIPSSTSSIRFDSLLGWATEAESLQVQISRDGGGAWQTVYSETGCAEYVKCQNSFSTVSIPLHDYADSLIHVRFLYHSGGSYYPCFDSYCGLLVDNIQVENADEVTETVTTSLNDTSFAITGHSPDSYVMAIRAVPWDGYPAIDWGPLHHVTMKEKAELTDVIKSLNSLGSDSSDYNLTEVIEILQILTGD